jgi:isopenicillin-N N-acyltransferase-like protein
MELKRVDNIDILCTDLEPMVDFYHRVLGLRFNLPYERAQGWAGFQAGDVVLYLMEISARDHLPRRTPVHDECPPGIDSFAFEVDDLDEAIDVLGGRGVEWAGQIIESDWYRYRAFYDAEGNMLHVTEPKPAVRRPTSGRLKPA